MKTKVVISILASLLLTNVSNATENSPSIYSEIISQDTEIVIPNDNSDKFNYKFNYEYTSEELESSEKFTLVGLEWNEIKPQNSVISLEARTKSEGVWSEWVNLEIEEADRNALHDHSHSHDEEEHQENSEEEAKVIRSFGTIVSNPSDSFQYRFFLEGDGISTPKVSDLKIEFLRVDEEINQSLSSSLSGVIAATLGDLTILPRGFWGANEELRYRTDNDPPEELANLGSDFYEKFKDELVITRTIDADQNGRYYKWPLQYPEKIRKVVIHHTAGTNNLNDPSLAMRNIYYYHTMSRGWGDIGYNYVIDQQGRIYEGRFGGETVIGAHSGAGNNGSIGIALLGNYQDYEVPEAALNSLIELVAHKSLLHNLDPNGYSLFRGENYANIFGHRDISSTTCPGQNLYNLLPEIRNRASSYIQTELNNKEDYSFLPVFDYQQVNLKSDKSEEVILKFKNIGRLTWNSNTSLELKPNYITTSAVEISSSTLIEKEVRPGGIGSFRVNLKSLGKLGNFQASFRPKINGSKTVNFYGHLPIIVEAGTFDYEFYSEDKLPISMKTGERFTYRIKLKNTGDNTWYNTGSPVIKLGADNPRDHYFKLVSPVSPRVASLEESSVKSGEIGTFKINVVAPSETGHYKEYFTPVIEGVSWLENKNLFLETNVYDNENKAELISQTKTSVLKPGDQKNYELKLRNLSPEVWYKTNFKINLESNFNLDSSSFELVENSVGPGEVATIKGNFKLSQSNSNGQKYLMIIPKVNSKTILKDPSYYFFYLLDKENMAVSNLILPSETVQASSQTQKKIRVKISFEGEPIIKSLGGAEMYLGDSKVSDLSANDLVSSSFSSQEIVVNQNGRSWNSSNPIRIIPKNNSILELVNHENRPEWNPDINDNLFRGVLEMRIDDGKIIVVNELPVEDYLKGIGEVSNSTPYQKIKTILVAARTYALYYIDKDVKFAGKPYNLDDSDLSSQKYLGYGLETRAANIVKAVNETDGEVVTYNGELIKTPYFSESDGTRTKSAQEVWGWTNTPYLISVDDSYCDKTAFYGHGVGLSGCGSDGMAREGKNYQEILKHYYTGVEISKYY